jgi:hypothetical protein
LLGDSCQNSLPLFPDNTRKACLYARCARPLGPHDKFTYKFEKWVLVILQGMLGKGKLD